MAKVSFTNLKLKINSEVKEIKYNDVAIEIKQYLPIEEKIDLIQIALQNAEENGIYNDIRLDMYFHLYLVYLYTNLNFTDKQKEDEYKLFDILESNGLIDAVIGAIPESEYDRLLRYIEVFKHDILTYKNTAGAVLQTVIQDLPKNAAAAAEIVNSFDPEKYQSVQDMIAMANQTGMNNSIPVNAIEMPVE
jgi:hypothetical protein